MNKNWEEKEIFIHYKHGACVDQSSFMKKRDAHVCGGLAIVKAHEFKEHVLSITHINTGLSITKTTGDLEHAKMIANALLEISDWKFKDASSAPENVELNTFAIVLNDPFRVLGAGVPSDKELEKIGDTIYKKNNEM